MSRAAAGRSLLLLRLALLLLCAWSTPTLAGETEIIVSPDQSAVTVDRGMLRAIFTTRLRQWPDGTPIRLFVMPDDNALHDQFCREQLGMYPYLLRELWDRLLYTGTGLTPTVVHSEAEMRSRVHATPGAIGYVPAGGGSRGPGDNSHAAASAPRERISEKDQP